MEEEAEHLRGDEGTDERESQGGESRGRFVWRKTPTTETGTRNTVPRWL